MLKAQCIKNGKYVAIKCMKNHFDSLDQVNNLREIQALRRLSPHGNIIKLLEVLYDQPTGRLALVFELMDMNIYELIRGRRHYVAEDRVKTYLYQLTKSMDHMHRNGIFHRDIKPENILIMDDCLKLADFGSCRGIYSKQPYTEYISTRWYRAPECLLTDGYYNYKMDMWGVGCVFFEIVSLFPLFPGTNELDQIQKIHNIIGTPSAELLGKMKQRSAHMDFNFPQKSGSGIEKLIPHATPECIDLINKLLAYNPDDRLSARQALRHPYFREIREMEKRQYALMNPKADGTLSGSGGDDSRKGHHGSAVTSSDARSDRTRRSRASASVASTSVPSIAGKGIGEGIGGYEPGGGHRRSQPGGVAPVARWRGFERAQRLPRGRQFVPRRVRCELDHQRGGYIPGRCERGEERRVRVWRGGARGAGRGGWTERQTGRRRARAGQAGWRVRRRGGVVVRWFVQERK